MSEKIKNETEIDGIIKPSFSHGEDGQSIIITMPGGFKRVLTWNYKDNCDWFLDNVKKPSLIALLNELMPWANDINQVKRIAFSLYEIKDHCNEISRLNQSIKDSYDKDDEDDPRPYKVPHNITGHKTLGGKA